MRIESINSDDIVLHGEHFSLKIGSDRKVYIRKDTKDFLYIGKKIRRGLSRREKEEWLLKLKQKLEEELKEERYRG